MLRLERWPRSAGHRLCLAVFSAGFQPTRRCLDRRRVVVTYATTARSSHRPGAQMAGDDE
jgi:hypothetical protein